MTGIIESLRLEHANVGQMLSLLEEQLEDGSGADYGMIKSILDYLASYPDQYHHPKEDLIYRALLGVDPKTGAALDDLEAEHVELAERTQELVFAVGQILSGTLDGDLQKGGWLNETLRSYVGFYFQHMAKEESEFFPMAERLLPPETLDSLKAEVADVSDPVFSEFPAGPYATLRNKLS